MKSRKVVAAVMLASSLAMPMVVSELSRGEDTLVDAQWAAALGMSRREAFWFGVGSTLLCSAIPNPGAVACGLAGVA